MTNGDRVALTKTCMARAALVPAMRPTRPVWIGDDGRLRIGHSGDFVDMLERLGVRTSA